MRRFPHTSKKMLLLALMSVACMAAFGLRRWCSDPDVSVTFVGWVDNDPETTYARFAISNHSTRSIEPGGLIAEMPTAQFHDPSYRRSGSGFVRPRQVEIVTVLAPLEEGPWRVHLSFAIAGLRHSAATWYAKLFDDTPIYAVTPDALRFDPNYEVQSDWVMPDNNQRHRPATAQEGAR